MDGFNVLSIKLNQCRNCFSIAQNDRYVAAVGDQIVIYQKENWAVQCVVPSKVFVHPYSLHFLSEHTFIVKNNYAQYMVYDVLKQKVLWKFKPRGYDSIDINLIVSSSGKVFDIFTYHNYNSCCSQLVISPDTQQYEIRDLAETEIPVEAWHGQGSGCSTIRLNKGLDQKMYLLKGYIIDENLQKGHTVEYVLFQNSIDVPSLWIPVKQWRFDKPIRFKARWAETLIVRDEIRMPVYFDEQYIIWNNFECEDWRTGQHYCHDEMDNLDTPFLVKRRYDSQHIMDFWVIPRGHVVQIRQYKTWDLVPAFYDIENWCGARICDIAILDNASKVLIGTMSGLFLCNLMNRQSN